jgi:acyl carrier protein
MDDYRVLGNCDHLAVWRGHDVVEAQTAQTNLEIKTVSTKQRVKTILFEQCQGYFGAYDVKKPDDIPDDAVFDELHMDSLDRIEFAIDLESEFDIEISDTVCEKWATVKDVLSYLDAG